MLRLLVIICAVFVFGPPAEAKALKLTKAQISCLMVNTNARSAQPECVLFDQNLQKAAEAYASAKNNYDEYYACFILNIGEGCSDLALFSKDEKIPETVYAAIFFNEKACRLKDYEGCEDFIEALTEIRPVKKNNRLYETLCQRGALNACLLVGPTSRLLDSGLACLGLNDEMRQITPGCIQLDKNIENLTLAYALDDYEVGDFYFCYERDQGKFCGKLAENIDVTYEENSETLKIQLYDKACRLGHKQSCSDRIWTLEEMYDSDTHKALYRKLCHRKLPGTCVHDANSQKADQDKINWAVRYFEKAAKP